MQGNRDVCFGNAVQDNTPEYRHWLVGSFMPQEFPLHSTVAELKYGTHERGECRTREQATSSPTHTSMGILITGKVRYSFPDRDDVVLENQGDYVVWGPNVLHWWEILEPTLILTIRWKEDNSD